MKNRREELIKLGGINVEVQHLTNRISRVRAEESKGDYHGNNTGNLPVLKSTRLKIGKL